MANRIGNTHIMTSEKLQYELDVPKLINILELTEANSSYFKAFQILNGLLEAIAIRSLQIGDPVLVDILARMKIIKQRPEEE